MMKLLSILAVPALALSATATAAAAGEPTKSFTHDGITYVYVSEPLADGATVLSGQVLQTGAKFRLVVRDGRVSGHADHQPVSFSVAGTRGAADGAVVVDRGTRVTVAD